MLSFVRNHPVLVVALAIFVALAGATANKLLARQDQGLRGGFGANEVLVVVAAARMQSIIDEIEAIGTTRANEAITVTAKVTETIRRLNFDDGELVEKGAVLVELTNAEETAQLAEARSNLGDARQHFERVRDLVARQSAPRAQLDEARARLEASQARLEAIEARLEDRLIRAPFGGLLGFRQVSPGTLVVPNTEITTLDDISIMKLDFSVPEIFIADLKPGLEVLARSPAFPDRKFAGVVRSIDTRVDPVTRSLTVRALLPNEDSALRPGMLMTVRLVRSRAPTLVVPESALVQVQDRQHVFTVEGDLVQQTPVRIGRRRPGLVEILEGLEPGQQVVTEGIAQLRPGARVRVRGE